MNHKLAITSLAALIALSACGPKAEQTADAAGNSLDNAVAAVGDTTSNAVDAAKDAITPTPTPQQFIDTAAQSDAFEIAAAKLAKKQAASADVKDLAAKMIDAHTTSTAKVKAAAAAAVPSLTPDPTLTQGQKDRIADLEKLKGADFDKAYISGQVDAHKDALSLLKDYADNGTAPTLKATAADLVPIVQDHLDMARALDK